MNPGAEDGVANWTQVEGSFESIASGECAGNNAHSGSRLFAVGGVCNPNAYGEGYQDIDVSSYVDLIDSDSAVVFFGGYLSDYSGSDVPGFKLGFLTSTTSLSGQPELMKTTPQNGPIYMTTYRFLLEQEPFEWC